MSTEPDWSRLNRIAADILTLQAAGTWNRFEYDRLLKEAEIAAAGFTPALEFVVNEADAKWVGL